MLFIIYDSRRQWKMYEVKNCVKKKCKMLYPEGFWAEKRQK